jgi:hypothetical protein
MASTTGPGRCVRRWSAGLAAAAAVAVLAGCGSAGHGNAGSGPGYSDAVKFSACMRTHGVTNFPDPTPGGGGIHIQAGSGVEPFSPSFKAAQHACQKLLPGGGPRTGHPSARDIAQTRRTSVCMRAHGVSQFPDPIFTPPSDPQDYGLLEDRGGVIFAVPRTINVQSPVFEAAAKACNFR